MTAVAPSVLIAEHDDVARLFLADNLHADGYWPVCAADTAAALELLSGAPDALIVDVNGDTLGVVDAIREETRPEVDPQLPILVLTSHSSELHRVRLLERGADDWSARPTPTSSCAPDSARCCAARRPAAPRRCSVPGRCDSMSAHAARGPATSRSSRCAERSYQLLVALIGEPDRGFTREELLRSA
jgi:two-component system, OmpR family, response regulator MtrA